MGEPNRQYQPVELQELRRRLQARLESVKRSNEHPLEEMARIIGGNGQIIPANADVRSQSVFEKASLAKTSNEMSFKPESATRAVASETPSPRVAEEQASGLFFDVTEDIESDRSRSAPIPQADDSSSGPTDQDEDFEAIRAAFDVEWQDQDLDTATEDESEAFASTRPNRAYPRLRNYRRRNLPLYAASAGALMVVGALVAVFVRPGVSVGVAPTPGPTSTAMVVRPPQPDVVPASQPTPPNSAAASGAQLSPVPPPAQSDPASQALAGSPPTQSDQASQASAGSAPAATGDVGSNSTAAQTAAPQDSVASADSLFFQPRRVQTIPVYSDGSYASPPDAAATADQSGSGGEAGGQQAGEAQPFQSSTTASTPDSQPTAPAASAADSDNHEQTVASRESSAPAAPATSKPATAHSSGGRNADAILASTKAETEARTMLGTLQKKYGAAIAGHRLSYHRVKHSDGTVFQVRVAGLGKPDAQALCDKVTKAGGSCQVGSQ